MIYLLYKTAIGISFIAKIKPSMNETPRIKPTKIQLMNKTEYAVLDEDGNLIGTFQTVKEAQLQAASKSNCSIYKFVTYKVTTSQKL